MRLPCLFLLMDNNIIVGTANVYIIQEISKVLNVAEFFILKELRNKGYGTSFFYLICDWGIENQCKTLSLEVDKDKYESNLFWKSLKLDLDEFQDRNIYKGTIYARKTY